MPNPGFIRYLTAAVNAIGVVYLLTTGEALPQQDADALTQGVNGSAAAILGLFNTLSMLYSKLVPSTPKV